MSRNGRSTRAASKCSVAIAGIERINSDYQRHARHALDVARAHFDARVVLPKLLEVATQ